MVGSLKAGLLGEGMLDRARATSLALLGATAAVGLAIVALALNQEWPLLAGSSIPAAPHQAVGDASVVAHSGSRVSRRVAVSPRAHAPGAHRGTTQVPSSHRANGAAPAGHEASSRLVVSTSTPVSSPTEQAAPSPPAPPAEEAAQQPEAQQAPASPAPTSPAPEPVVASSHPSPGSHHAHDAAPPKAVTAEAPPVESEGHGNGHAYGHEENDESQSHADGEEGYEDGGREDPRGWSHGHAYGHDH